MIENYLRKFISLAIVATTIIAFNPIGASAEWKKDNIGWWYLEGDSWATGWRSIDGNWYYFHSNGYMAHDTTIDGYYLSSSGSWIENYNNSLSNTENTNKFSIINEIIKLRLTKDGVIDLLGSNYESVDTGAEGILKGYRYKNIGITVAFGYGEDRNKVQFIECDDTIDINGAKIGMSFEQIEKLLGNGNRKSYENLPDVGNIYELNYIIQDCKVSFTSYMKEGEVKKIYISHK